MSQLICTQCRPYKAIKHGQFLDHIAKRHPAVYDHYVRVNQANYMEAR